MICSTPVSEIRRKGGTMNRQESNYSDSYDFEEYGTFTPWESGKDRARNAEPAEPLSLTAPVVVPPRAPENTESSSQTIKNFARSQPEEYFDLPDIPEEEPYRSPLDTPPSENSSSSKEPVEPVSDPPAPETGSIKDAAFDFLEGDDDFNPRDLFDDDDEEPAPSSDSSLPEEVVLPDYPDEAPSPEPLSDDSSAPVALQDPEEFPDSGILLEEEDTEEPDAASPEPVITEAPPEHFDLETLENDDELPSEEWKKEIDELISDNELEEFLQTEEMDLKAFDSPEKTAPDAEPAPADPADALLTASEEEEKTEEAFRNESAPEIPKALPLRNESKPDPASDSELSEEKKEIIKEDIRELLAHSSESTVREFFEKEKPEEYNTLLEEVLKENL